MSYDSNAKPVWKYVYRDHVDDLDDDNDGILDLEDEDDDGDGIVDGEVNILSPGEWLQVARGQST